MTIHSIPIRLGNGANLNGQEVTIGETIGLQPLGGGLTAVTLTIFCDDLTIDWGDLPENAHIIAPEEIMENVQAIVDADNAETQEAS